MTLYVFIPAGNVLIIIIL